MKIHTSLFCFPFLVMIFACTSVEKQASLEPLMIPIRNASPDKPITEILDSLKVDKDLLMIYVDKSELILQLKHDSLLIKSYPVVLGGNAVDDKRRQGDNCTPEGEFELRDLYPHRAWSKFLWINYPTADSWQKHNADKEAGKIPASSSIGGEIGIHGVPDDNNTLIDETMHWTAGCISLKNKDIDEIYSVVHIGTKVVIVK